MSLHPGTGLPEGDEAPPPGVRVAGVVRWVLVGLTAVAALAAVSSYVTPLVFHEGSHENTAAAGIEYTCPMHPSVVRDAPGQCPICGMDLVPRPRGTKTQATDKPAVPGLTALDLPPERVQLIGLKTSIATDKTLAAELRVPGYVSADETRLAEVQARVAGWIEELSVSQTGQQVHRGDLLARLYSPELLSAQQEFLTAHRWNPGSGPNLEQDARRRLELLGVSPGDIDAIAESGTPMRAVKLRAPASGHVIAKNVVVGAYVEPGAKLFTIADLSHVWVIAEVPEQGLGRVRQGQSATLTLPAYPGRTFPGTVQLLAPALDPATRTLRVRVELENRSFELKPGMYGDVHIALAAARGLVVPSQAVLDTGELQYVFVVTSPGHFEPRPVKLGERGADEVQVQSGLQAGDVVVTNGAFLLDSESRMRGSVVPGATP
jgi:membrane fusion protein, copper/silver efflux system